MGIVRSGLWGQMPLGTGQTHAHREPRAQPSADMSVSLDMYAQDVGVDVIPN